MSPLFLVPAIVSVVAFCLTVLSSYKLWRDGARALGAGLASLAAMVPPAALCWEHVIRVLTHSMGNLALDGLTFARLGTAWMLFGPLLFTASFGLSSRAKSSRTLNLVRSAHVVGWTIAAPAALYTMINV